MEAINPPEEARHPAPSPSASPTRPDKDVFWGRGKDNSLESFAITTTPFHESEEDGEYYMDEAGNMLHRWVVKTEVKGIKPARTRGDVKLKSAKQNSDQELAGHQEEHQAKHSSVGKVAQEDKENNSKADSGWGSAVSTMESSGSSTEEAVQRQTVSSQPLRPRMNRHSRSSFRPSERANHASPERSSVAGKYQTEMVGTPEEEKSSIKLAEPSNGSDSDLHPLQLSKALSCPCSPTQAPVSASAILSSQPSPELTRAQTFDVQQLSTLDNLASSSKKARAPLQARSHRSSYHTSSYSRSTPGNLQIRPRIRNSTEDPYVAHQRAMLLFSPPPVPVTPKPVERTQSGEDASSASSMASASNATKTISAASYLASKSNKVIPARGASGSKRNSTLSATASDPAANSNAEVEAKSGTTTPDANKSSFVPILTDHRVALDWTHPETRAREERRRNGLVGRMKRMLSRSRSRDRAAEWQDDGSVRRMRIGSFGSADLDEEHTQKGRGRIKEQTATAQGPERGAKRAWNCFG